jgi:glutamate dehydrogenase
VAEGGNLGFTQLARIRYSRRGGRINTDFIDNAAGVATSDREVNLKILLGLAIERERLDPTGRDGYLDRSASEVVEEVLSQVDHSVQSLSRAVPGSARELDAYEALVDTLEDAGRFDRTVECLPTTEEFRVRRDAGAGLIRPELAVLLAYAKTDLVAAIESSQLVDDPALADVVVPYFPAPIRESFRDLIPEHRLYPQLVATDLAGEIVDELGIVWAHETAAELGRDLADVAGAFWAARQVVGADERWAELEAQSAQLPADAEAALHLTISAAVARLARAYLSSPGLPRVSEVVSRDTPLAAALATIAPSEATKSEEDSLVSLGANHDLAHRFVTTAARADVGQAEPVARATGRDITDASNAVDLVAKAAGLDRLVDGINAALAVVPAPSRLTTWQGRALLDDVDAWRRAAASAALANPGPAGEAVSLWEAAHHPELGRAALLLSSSGLAAADPLATAALVLRRLQMAL